MALSPLASVPSKVRPSGWCGWWSNSDRADCGQSAPGIARRAGTLAPLQTKMGGGGLLLDDVNERGCNG